MAELSNTQYFKVKSDPQVGVKQIIGDVFAALSEKGYNPVGQIVGYIMSGDPSFITSHNNARNLIQNVERDELVEELLKEYIKSKAWEKNE